MSAAVQLKTGLWIDALIRRAQVGGAFACIAQKGDRDAGSVLITVRGRQNMTLYVPERDMDGVRVWRGQIVDEAVLDALITSRLKFDSDLNVVDIDDPAHTPGRHFIEEDVLNLAFHWDGPTVTSDALKEASPAAHSGPALSESSGASADAVAAAKALFREE